MKPIPARLAKGPAPWAGAVPGRTLILAAFAAVLMAAGTAGAQIPPGYAITRGAIGAGSASNSGGEYYLRGTAALYDAGILSGGLYTVKGGYPRQASPWLFLLYLNGDNDLADALAPVVDSVVAGSAAAPGAQAVVLWDGPQDDDSALYYVVAGTSTPVSTGWLPAEANLGDPQTLVEFVQWAREQIPTPYTFLSILDHGGGWSPTLQLDPPPEDDEPTFPSMAHYRFKGGTGLSWDYHTASGDYDYLSTAETHAALEAATSGGAEPIDLLFYDACLMGMLEEAHALSPYVSYFVASENEVWASDPYAAYLQAMAADPSPNEMAASVVAAYEASLPAEGHPFTLAALDLSVIGPVNTAFGALSQRLYDLVDDAALRQQVFAAYLATQKLDSDSNLVLEPEVESYLDLYGLAQNLATSVTDPEVVAHASALVDAWDAGVAVAEAHRSGTAWNSGEYWDLEQVHGLSVYLPFGEDLTMVITHTNGLTEAVPIRTLYGPEEAPNEPWRSFIHAYIAAEGPPPAEILGGPRDGLLPTRRTIYLPLAVRAGP